MRARRPGFQGLLNLLLELVKVLAQGSARFRRSGFQPSIADGFEAALFPAQPTQAKLFEILRRAESGDFLGDFCTERLKGGTEGCGFVAF